MDSNVFVYDHKCKDCEKILYHCVNPSNDMSNMICDTCKHKILQHQASNNVKKFIYEMDVQGCMLEKLK